MAKRRRLMSDPILPPVTGAGPMPPLEVKAHLRPGFGTPALPAPPIAQMAGQSAVTAALQEVSDALTAARTEGRLVQRLPLDVIDPFHLVRDRMGIDEEEMAALVDSLRNHGQRTPIEVTEIAAGRYGLISGWRRLTALRRLAEKTGETRFTTVLALLRKPETAGDAYVAMVEENEIRLGLSYYERARIAAKAVDLGVFPGEKQALQQLYAAASRSKRSKIGSFLRLYRQLDGVLRYPANLTERLGLALAQIAEAEPACLAPLVADLTAHPAQDAEAEQMELVKFVRYQSLNRQSETDFPDSVPAMPPDPVAVATESHAESEAHIEELRPGVFMRVDGGWTKPILTLSGPSVDAEFRERLTQWLQTGR